MQYRILGPLVVLSGDRELPLGALKDKTVLAVLLLHANEVVSRQQLIDELWGESPPPSAIKAVNGYVWQLRKALGDNGSGPIATRSPGYTIAVGSDHLDALQFEALTAEARARANEADTEEASTIYDEALMLWRGPALSGIALESVGRQEVERLDESRILALMDRIDCDLALGRHDALVGELNVLVAQHPLRERLYAQQMLALYRSGRQADALRAYQQARTVLVEELGLEPSPALQRLERGVLTHDPSLQTPNGSVGRHGPAAAAPLPVPDGRRSRPRRSRRRALTIAAAAVIALAAAVVVGFAVSGSSGDASVVAPSSVAVLDARSGAVVGDVTVGRDPLRVVVGNGAAWTINGGDNTLSRIDARTLRTRTIGLPATPAGLAAAAGAVWVGNGEAGSISLIDSRTGFAQTRPVGSEAHNGRTVPRFASAIAADGRSAWAVVGISPPRLVEVDADGTVRPTLADGLASLVLSPNALAVTGGVAWSLAPGVLTRDDLQRHVTTTIPIGSPLPDALGGTRLPTGLAVGASGVWATNPYEHLVEEVSRQTGAQLATVRLGDRPTSVAAADDMVWAGGINGDVTSIDASTATVRKTVHLGHPVTGIAVGYGRVWVSVAG